MSGFPRSKSERRVEAVAEGLGDAIKGFINLGVFAAVFWLLRDVWGLAEPWALGGAVVMTLSETRRRM